MTEAELLEIEKRANEAADGPWWWSPGGAELLHGEGYDGKVISLRDGRLYNPEQDFIAHARTDVPKLVAEVKRLRKALVSLGYDETWEG